MPSLLILGGTREAVTLAAECAAWPGWRVVTSLAGVTRDPRKVAGELRRGGFGGAAGLADYSRANAIDFLIDATHPYAGQISAHAASASRQTGVPLLHLVRPAWLPQPADNWRFVADTGAAVVALRTAGAQRVLLTIGHRGLSALPPNLEIHWLIRLIEPPREPLQLPSYRLLLARGPFTEEAELELLVSERIDAVMAKNSGGSASYGKLAAARRLGLPVVMIARPPPPAGSTVTTVAAALSWLRQQMRQRTEMQQ